MSIYYFANQVYQYSNAMPLYRAAGGIFILKKAKGWVQFKKYLRNGGNRGEAKRLLNTPPHIFRDIVKENDLKGIIVSLSNAVIPANYGNCKTIFIGHGAGDKKYGSSARNLESYDYHFISGPKHLAKLKDVGLNIPKDKLIPIGNLRFDDYLNGKIDRGKVLDRLGIRDRSRKNILYAPTWNWGNGTLHKYVHRFAEELSREHNLIVRPHHHDRMYIGRLRRWAALHGLRHVYFSNPAAVIKSDTMDDFAASDLMISDTSSILYEYLVTGNPIIVAQTEHTDLHQMPDEMNIMKHVTLFDGSQDILQLVNENLQKNMSKAEMTELLHHCFYFNDGKSVGRALDFIRSIKA